MTLFIGDDGRPMRTKGGRPNSYEDKLHMYPKVAIKRNHKRDIWFLYDTSNRMFLGPHAVIKRGKADKHFVLCVHDYIFPPVRTILDCIKLFNERYVGTNVQCSPTTHTASNGKGA